jgi:glutamate racemase
MNFKDYIGVFDSGVGGISVLKELIRELPYENFLFFGDSANAPYGEKTTEEIQHLSMNIADHLVEEGVKAIVIACNTATSAAASLMREKYQAKMPVIGEEPALKPAAEADEDRDSKILVMATPATLRLEKFQKLKKRLEYEAEFIPVACVGLAARIEKGNFEAPDLKELLQKLIGPYKGKVDGIVLGCTHYPFVKKQIREVMGDVPLFDGGEGTARELRRELEERSLLRKEQLPGKVVFQSSLDTPEELKLYQWLLEYKN